MKNFSFIIIIFILQTSFNSFSQTFNVSLDTTNNSLLTFKPHIIIEDSISDSLSYEIKLYSFDNQDTSLVYVDTFSYHNPKILSFDFIDFRYQNYKVYLTLKELNIAPFILKINVLSSVGILVEELIFEDYE